MANFDLETEFRRKQLQKMKNISIIILFRKNGLLAVEVRGLSTQGFLMHSYQRWRVKMGSGD